MYAEHSGHAHYVTARSGAKTALLAGPFRTHREALDVEPAARRLVRELYPRDLEASFAEIGTSRATIRPGRRAPLGKLNDRLGVPPARRASGTV